MSNIEWVATAGDNKVRFRNIGIDLVRVEPDGTVIESIARLLRRLRAAEWGAAAA